ncbi:MAG: holo-ACP synthase [bacterium]|nr:holo-ACP synthase [bacterium]
MSNIRGVGIDIEEARRFRNPSFQKQPSFYQKIFTTAEIRYCLSKEHPYRHFAARFAAKEAILKCLRSTIYKIRDIEIMNNKKGAPSVKVKGRTGKFLISMSHTRDHGAAIAIWLN